MKRASLLILSPLLLLAACRDKKDTAAKPPAAVPVAETPAAIPDTTVPSAVQADNAFRPDGTPRQRVVIGPDGATARPPVAIPVPEDEVPTVDVDEDEPSPAPRTPGEHLDRAIERTGQGLQTAGEKTEQGVRTAAEKTDEGLRKAADATGRWLQRAGEKIENDANRQQQPPR